MRGFTIAASKDADLGDLSVEARDRVRFPPKILTTLDHGDRYAAPTGSPSAGRGDRSPDE